VGGNEARGGLSTLISQTGREVVSRGKGGKRPFAKKKKPVEKKEGKEGMTGPVGQDKSNRYLAGVQHKGGVDEAARLRERKSVQTQEKDSIISGADLSLGEGVPSKTRMCQKIGGAGGNREGGKKGGFHLLPATKAGTGGTYFRGGGKTLEGGFGEGGGRGVTGKIYYWAKLPSRSPERTYWGWGGKSVSRAKRDQ